MGIINVTKGSAVVPVAGLNKVYLIENTLDMSVLKPTATDVLEAIPIKAKQYVLGVMVEELVAEGGACTIDVGDGSVPNRYHNDLSINAGAGTFTPSATTAVNLHTVADTIDVLINSANTDLAKIRLVALVVDLS